MKYAKIEYDFNRPTNKVLTEPLNSDYGVAVKVYKDGQLVDADLSVDGVACEEGFDGWKLAKLSSGNIQQMNTVEVEVSEDPTVKIHADGQDTHTNDDTLDHITTFAVPLSSVLSEETTVDVAYVKEISWTVVEGEMGQYVPVMMVGDKSQRIKQWKWNAAQRKWQNNLTQKLVDIVTINSSSYLMCSASVPASSSLTLKLNLDIDSGDGFNTKFPLYVQQKDLGYFEK